MSDARALVFDLDDTLYPYRQFLSSGFRAVASAVEREHGVSSALALRTLWHARTGNSRGREVQHLCGVLDLPAAIAPALVALIRDHVPTLRLPDRSRRMLQALRPGWRLGILTNGTPEVQARKVAALGIAPFVDTVVFARACGDGRGKPASDGFQRVLEHLHTPAGSSVFVGDDAVADIEGAAGVGMRTIHLVRGRRTADAGLSPACCDATVTTLLRVPEVAGRLLVGGGTHVV
ncbi:MAG: HAD family hydrolase [Acidobacteria bacterium]|nr:HAD family hydrolase [Acidobacteriota bacterium]